MRMKINGVSYLFWFLYAAMAASLSTIFVYSICIGLWGMNMAGMVAVTVCFFALTAAVNLLGRKAVIAIQSKYPRFANRIRNWEYICWVLILVGAVIYRFYLSVNFTGSMSEEYLFYRMALDRTPDVSAAVIHRITGLYTYLLFQLFHIFGDKMVVGVIFNAFLQIIGMTFLYTGVKTLAGRVPALFSIAFVGFSSYSIYTMCNLTPVPLFFLFFAMGLYFIANFLKKEKAKEIQKMRIVSPVFIGFFLGFVFYLDVVGMILFILAGMLFVIKDRKLESAAEESRKQLALVEFKKSLIQYCVMLGSALVFWLGALLVDSLRWGQSFEQAFSEFFKEYADTANFQISFSGINVFTAIVLCFMGTLLIIGFWTNKKQKCDPWILALLVLAFMEYTGISWMNYRFFSAIPFVVLAGLGIISVGPEREELRSVKTAGAPPIIPEPAVNKPEPAAHTVEATIIESQSAAASSEENKVNYIENPLPLPKKHEKKEMDFDRGETKDSGSYDVTISEEDDFDL